MHYHSPELVFVRLVLLLVLFYFHANLFIPNQDIKEKQSGFIHQMRGFTIFTKYISKNLLFPNLSSPEKNV